MTRSGRSGRASAGGVVHHGGQDLRRGPGARPRAESYTMEAKTCAGGPARVRGRSQAQKPPAHAGTVGRLIVVAIVDSHDHRVGRLDRRVGLAESVFDQLAALERARRQES